MPCDMLEDIAIFKILCGFMGPWFIFQKSLWTLELTSDQYILASHFATNIIKKTWADCFWLSIYLKAQNFYKWIFGNSEFNLSNAKSKWLKKNQMQVSWHRQI